MRCIKNYCKKTNSGQIIIIIIRPELCKTIPYLLLHFFRSRYAEHIQHIFYNKSCTVHKYHSCIH